MKNSKVSGLNRAIFTLLYDQFDCPDMTMYDDDETFVDYIVYALIEKNGHTCPFKNYDCEERCKDHTQHCYSGDLIIDCGKEKEVVWKEFINRA